MFASVSQRVIETINEPIEDVGVGNAAITPRWQLLGAFGADETPRDIAFDEGVIFAPSSGVEAPEAYFDRPFDDIQTLGRGLRASADLRTTTRLTDSAAQLTLNQPGVAGPGAVIPIGVRLLTDVGGGGTSDFRLVWGSKAVTVTGVPVVANTWNRVGFEILPAENIIRGYLNKTSNAQGTAANAALEVMAEIAINDPSGPAALPGPFFVGVTFSNLAAVDPSGGVPDFNGLDNLLIELFEGPVFVGHPPTGSPFTVPEEEAYTLFKATLAVHELLMRARLR